MSAGGNAPSFVHQPVMLTECVDLLNLHEGARVIDFTAGGGGHSAAMAQRVAPGGMVVAIDRDEDAIAATSQRLSLLQDPVELKVLKSDFSGARRALLAGGADLTGTLDGALFDLGVSSYQLDGPRGFSFMRDEPLDMRMDRTTGQSAADLLQTASNDELFRILRDFGEERFAAAIARRIVERRRTVKIDRTSQLVDIVMSAVPRAAWPKDKHVATRSFQAIRMAVNNELAQIEAGLDYAIDLLKPGGRLVVISFHSLEDRIVKQRFLAAAGRAPSPPGRSPAAMLPRNDVPVLRTITRKPLEASAEEVAINPRARSARLRAAEKL